jgi:GH24 family phage-related lysozyme (muramidase)
MKLSERGMAFIDSWGATHVPFEKVNWCLSTYVKLPLQSHEFDALGSLVSSIGCESFVASTLLAKMYQAKWTWQDIAEEFLSMKVQTGGRVLEPDELMRRREAERKMFLGAAP